MAFNRALNPNQKLEVFIRYSYLTSQIWTKLGEETLKTKSRMALNCKLVRIY